MPSSYTVGGVSHNSFDCDADGVTLYIAVLDSSGNPQILKMDSELGSDATLSYDPGAGSEIGVMCGDFDPYFIWASGQLGGTDRVVLTEDSNYWYVQNVYDVNYWYDDALPLLVGPGDDSKVTVAVEGTLHETYFVGESLYWMSYPGAPFIEIGAFDRLDINRDEVLAGTYWYDDTVISAYSPSSGEVWGDVTGVLPSAAVTSVIFG